MAAYLANVGANAAHPLRSPLNADGSFTVYPIPERVPYAPPMLRLADLLPTAATTLARYANLPVHADPDLASATAPPTYGDNCRRAGRAFSLRRAEPGDVILFVARLHPPAGAPLLHLVGALEVDAILPDVATDPGPGWWDANAHVRRARATAAWDEFWVFRGTPRSGWLGSAIPLDATLASSLLPILWRPTRTDQQAIASHTRAVRRLTGDAEARARELWNRR